MRTTGSDGGVTLQLIRRHAADLIAEHGFEAMNLRQLAGRVGITAGSLYNYIGSKQELLYELLREVMEDLLSAIEITVTPQPTPYLQLQAFVQLHVQFHVQRRNDVLIATTELRSLDTKHRNAIIHLRNCYEAKLGRIIRDGCQKGTFRVANVKLTTLAILPMLTGVALWYRPGGRLSREAMLRGYVRLVLSLVGVLPEALLPVLEVTVDPLPAGRPGDEFPRNSRGSLGAKRRAQP